MKVQFSRGALNSYGKPYSSPVKSYTIKGRISEEEGLAKAIDLFKKDHNLRNWQDLADSYSIS